MTRFYFGLLALLLLAPSSFAQGNGATLLAKIKQYSEYNDIWGYTAPNGDEYAIVGTTTGTAFYNCTDPTSPYNVGFISGPSSIWRDMKTYGEYAYIVTEGGGGMQIVDLSNPENPTLVKTWGTQYWSNAHNIQIDVGDAKAYACGTNKGLRVMDISNPTNPSLWATKSSPYIHDLHVQNGKAHLSEIYDGRYRISTVQSNFPTRDSIITPGSFTHSTWANEADTICVTTDEVNGGSIATYDISNPNNIQHLDTWTLNQNSIVHNAYIIGNVVYASWYTEGFVCADISDPSDIKYLASYDTSSYGSGSGYHGAWGCYPFSPSGVIYISDIEEGFHIIRVDGPAFEFTHIPVPNTQNEIGPYQVNADISAIKPNASTVAADLWYRVDNGSWNNVAMSATGVGDEWSGDLPGTPAPSVVEYYIHATDSTGATGWLPETSYPGDDVYSFAVGVIDVVYTNDFEGATNEGWTHGSTWGVDDWERGAPQGASGNSSRHEGTSWYDPGAAFSGALCWGNDLGNGSNGSYPSNSDNWMESPSIDCSGKTNTKLIFQRWMSVEAAPYDTARILVNGNVAWENPVGYTGDAFHIIDSSWRQQTVDISQWADGQSAVKVKFELNSDHVMELGGWNIDDFQIVSLQGLDPTDTIILSGPASVNNGSTATLSIDSAPANSPLWVLWSFKNDGAVISGHSFDLGKPIKIGARLTADGNGAASITTTPMPSAIAGRTLYLEIAATDSGDIFDSNIHALSVL
ncbi:MAG: hypothetical protein COB96_05810 [Planctomycetota bacterium]|nr:MAG: hypothetical protein COB96_05810 [Planctomycetota bacterium]